MFLLYQSLQDLQILLVLRHWA